MGVRSGWLNDLLQYPSGSGRRDHRRRGRKERRREDRVRILREDGSPETERGRPYVFWTPRLRQRRLRADRVFLGTSIRDKLPETVTPVSVPWKDFRQELVRESSGPLPNSKRLDSKLEGVGIYSPTSTEGLVSGFYRRHLSRFLSSTSNNYKCMLDAYKESSSVLEVEPQSVSRSRRPS